jgi:hypothetical protein
MKAKSRINLLIAATLILLIFQSSNNKFVSADVSQPGWWSGECDVNNHSGSHVLGSSLNGVKACGPGMYAQGGYDYLVHFAPGLWGEYEWECVELSMRYMYQAYGVAPYNAPGGKDVVWNYSGSYLQKISNSGTSTPSIGDVISMSETSTNPYGHTAVILAVNINQLGNGNITILEQNGLSNSNGSRSVAVSNNIVSENVTGWLHDPNSGASHPNPGAVSWGSGRIDVLGQGTNTNIFQKSFDGGSGWSNLWIIPIGGAVGSGPAVSTWGVGRLDLFARGTAGDLIHSYYDGAWHPWETLGFPGGQNIKAGTNPSAVSWGSGRIDVFVQANNGQMYQKYFSGGWSSWAQPITGTVGSGPAVSTWGVNRLDVFARGSAGDVVHAYFDGAWHPALESLGGGFQ